MDETLRQIGELLLQSVPTVIFMLLLYVLYTLLVHKPLVKVLAERREKTEEAIEKARADIETAEKRSEEYENRLREARAEVFRGQEARRQQAIRARAELVAEVQSKTQAQISEARAAIEKDKISAQEALQGESHRLAAEIVRAVLQSPGSPAPAGAR